MPTTLALPCLALPALCYLLAALLLYGGRRHRADNADRACSWQQGYCYKTQPTPPWPIHSFVAQQFVR
ncbi:hypothetical protein DL98DRAFT_511067 [Cadophora sp. DSE1049]|nr:hypothetical protein DL98DRAFT_511067 [Cadophora sp. DSE1049]